MEKEKLERLSKAGWKAAGTEEFLGLSSAEAALVELRLRLSDKLKQRRRTMKLSQTAFAKSIRSSQSRVAKMEASDSTVSIDLLIRSLFGSGITLQELSETISDR
ncbi:MAG: helix-turn-helix transcriptional regulator [Acidobacteria bacterium]|nr:helix-turn-helix transcriptional regulator [Acidobacteriota bacterium]